MRLQMNARVAPYGARCLGAAFGRSQDLTETSAVLPCNVLRLQPSSRSGCTHTNASDSEESRGRCGLWTRTDLVRLGYACESLARVGSAVLVGVPFQCLSPVLTAARKAYARIGQRWV
jgi:hypothetical protein